MGIREMRSQIFGGDRDRFYLLFVLTLILHNYGFKAPARPRVPDSKDAITTHVEQAPELARNDPIKLLTHDTNFYFTVCYNTSVTLVLVERTELPLLPNADSFQVEEEKDVLRKIDTRVLPFMLGACFLQQLDKSSLSYTSVFNIQADAHGKQYSWLGSVLYLAQLVFQPLGALLLVKLPTGKVISVAIFMWGVTMCSMAACKDFKSLLGLRFLLGSFESIIGMSCRLQQRIV